jgi:hypothetical protein
MIGLEEGFQGKRKGFQQRLFRTQAPIVGEVDEPAGLLEYPDASAVEIAGRRNRESMRVS